MRLISQPTLATSEPPFEDLHHLISTKTGQVSPSVRHSLGVKIAQILTVYNFSIPASNLNVAKQRRKRLNNYSLITNICFCLCVSRIFKLQWSQKVQIKTHVGGVFVVLLTAMSFAVWSDFITFKKWTIRGK